MKTMLDGSEKALLEIAEDEERQFALEKHLRDSPDCLSPEFVRSLLMDPYHVVRAEILDHILFSAHSFDEKHVSDLLAVEESELVRARLFLLAGRNSHRNVLERYKYLLEGDYERLYWNAGVFLADPTPQNLLSIAIYLFSDQLHVANTAVDLITCCRSLQYDLLIREVLRLALQFNAQLAAKLGTAV